MGVTYTTAAANTYVPIASYTVSAISTVSFTAIPSTYTDLVLVCSGKSSSAGSSDNNYRVYLNGDTATNYSDTVVWGNGTTKASSRDTTGALMYLGTVSQTSATGPAASTMHFANYSNSTTYKTVLARGDYGASSTNIMVGTWRSTAAVNRIDLYMTSATLTGTFSLYGIKAA